MEPNTLQDIAATRPVNEPDLSQLSINTVNQNEFSFEKILATPTHTGWMVRVTLPVGAENGPTPLFMIKNHPFTGIPCVRRWSQYNTGAVEAGFDGTNWALQDTYENVLGANVIPLNGAIVRAVGPLPFHSTVTAMFRLHRMDIKWDIRFQGSYTGAGLLQFVPIKSVPRFMENQLYSSYKSGGPQI